MFALGSANFLGSFVGSMPVVASLGRSAVNGASGARTTFGGIVTGLIILMACAFLTPHFAYIPTCALAAVIISAMIFTVDIDILESNQFMPEIMQRARIVQSCKHFPPRCSVSLLLKLKLTEIRTKFQAIVEIL
jgi:MFS superfamily sulfate permease-like transporter